MKKRKNITDISIKSDLYMRHLIYYILGNKFNLLVKINSGDITLFDTDINLDIYEQSADSNKFLFRLTKIDDGIYKITTFKDCVTVLNVNSIQNWFNYYIDELRKDNRSYIADTLTSIIFNTDVHILNEYNY